MQITAWAYDKRVGWERSQYHVFEGDVAAPKKKQCSVIFDGQEHLAHCITCGHCDCKHAMYVQERLRRRR